MLNLGSLLSFMKFGFTYINHQRGRTKHCDENRAKMDPFRALTKQLGQKRQKLH